MIFACNVAHKDENVFCLGTARALCTFVFKGIFPKSISQHIYNSRAILVDRINDGNFPNNCADEKGQPLPYQVARDFSQIVKSTHKQFWNHCIWWSLMTFSKVFFKTMCRPEMSKGVFFHPLLWQHRTIWQGIFPNSNPTHKQIILTRKNLSQNKITVGKRTPPCKSFAKLSKYPQTYVKSL